MTGDLNVYAGPGITYPFIGNASEGTTVQVTGRDKSGSWWQISWANGEKMGWVESNFVEIPVEVASLPNLPQLIVAPPATFTPTPTYTVTPIPPTRTPTNTPLPTGSPTAPANAARILVSNTDGYHVLDNQAMAGRDPTSAAFGPNGRELAATEGAKLYTIGVDGSNGYVWEEEDETLRPVEGIVWSPNGQLIAFVADRKQNCNPCRRVGIVLRAAQGSQPLYLEPPAGYNIGLPRWTQDGRLLATIYQDNPASGTVYIYDASGRGQPAAGSYLLSSSVEGQKWSPWLPGKSWQVDASRPTSYYSD